MRVEIRRVDWPFASAFRIAYQTRTVAETVVVELHESGHRGRGEALGVSYQGESAASLLEQIEAIRSDLVNGVSRGDLEQLLPPGGARNAVDCALWDLEAKRAGRRAWELAGVPSVKPLLTAYTLGIDSPAAMGRAAAAARAYSILKIKLAGEDDLARVSAIRESRPDAQIIVDANQAWNEQQVRELPPLLARLGVKLIEQPLPAGQDDVLAGLESPIPLCADESCQSTPSLAGLVGKYRYISIKLDKTGGLTEALRLARAARELKFELMVGCMAGSSLSMAPAFIVGQQCRVVDLDGPLLAAADVASPIRYDGSWMFPPDSSLWG